MLIQMIRKIKQDIDHSVSEIRFKAYQDRIDYIIKHMDNICDIFYLLAINYR